MKKLLFLLLFLLLPVGAWGAILDIAVGLVSETYYSQTHTDRLTTLTNIISKFTSEAGVTTYLSPGGLINTSLGGEGPLSSNFAGLSGAFSGKSLYAVIGKHDTYGIGVSRDQFCIDSGGMWPAEHFTQDIGSNWRVIGFSTNLDYPGFFVSSATQTWLSSALAAAQTAGKHVIIMTDTSFALDTTPGSNVVTPGGTTGTVHVTTPSAGTFASNNVGTQIFLRQGSTWGWGDVTVYNSSTDITVSVTQAFASTDAADEWGLYRDQNPQYVYNAGAIRTIIEAYSTIVKLCIAGYDTSNIHQTINGIRYLEVGASYNSESAGLLYLYADGTYALAGDRSQASDNWTQWYVGPSGSNSYGGRLRSDPKLTLNGVITAAAAAGSMINVLSGNYSGLTSTLDGLTWTFESGAYISGFSTISSSGWSGPDGNGWYTKALTTEAKIVDVDGIIATYGTYNTACTAGRWSWNSATLYYCGDPTGHTIEAGQADYGITCGATCTNQVFNSPKIKGFNGDGYIISGAASVIINNGEFYNNVEGGVVSASAGQVTINRSYFHHNHNSGMSFSSTGTVQSIVNYALVTYNALTGGTGSAGIRIWNLDYAPIINNATVAYNYIGIRNYQSGTTTGPFTNVVTYGNTDSGIYDNGSSHGLITYSIINDTQKFWGGMTSSHLLTSDPKFISSSDFHLQPGSPAINAGVDVGLTSDYRGLSIVGAPDIGAYESRHRTVRVGNSWIGVYQP